MPTRRVAAQASQVDIALGDLGVALGLVEHGQQDGHGQNEQCGGGRDLADADGTCVITGDHHGGQRRALLAGLTVVFDGLHRALGEVGRDGLV